MLATFNGTWDWTAIGTLALAGVTLAAVIVGAVSLWQTRQAIALSRKEVEEAHRPVVVPIADSTAKMDVHIAKTPLEKTPQLLKGGRLFVPVRNIGAGPALNVEVSIALLDDAGAAGARPGQTHGRSAGLGPDRTIPLLIVLHGWGNGDEPASSFALFIDYDVVAGKSWRTNAIYLGQGIHHFDAITFEALPKRKRPASDMIRPAS
ncbi:MAG: hypothetical protein ACYDHN_01630 [Solirubrobacteraceae bacterium]